jgi:hypothetical protein
MRSPKTAAGLVGPAACSLRTPRDLVSKSFRLVRRLSRLHISLRQSSCQYCFDVRDGRLESITSCCFFGLG